MMITTDAIMAAMPRSCRGYTRERVAGMIGDGVTPRQLAELDIPVADRLWGLIFVALAKREQRLLACDCAERALLRERVAGREPNAQGWATIEVVRRYAEGQATDTELTTARDAAWAAAEDVAGGAAAEDAAWAAEWIAARAAERVAVQDAERVAEREWQLARALEYSSKTTTAK